VDHHAWRQRRRDVARLHINEVLLLAC
jgi:hypothetical protein